MNRASTYLYGSRRQNTAIRRDSNILTVKCYCPETTWDDGEEAGLLVAAAVLGERTCLLLLVRTWSCG
jgi:hypothetical protein